MSSWLADAPSSFPATQQDQPTRAHPLEDATASLLLMSGATNPEGRIASVRDIDLNKEPNDPLPDESPKTSCTILLSPDSSHVQVNMDVEMETMVTTVMDDSSKINRLVDVNRNLEERSADETLEATSGKKGKTGSGPNRAGDHFGSAENAMASSVKEKCATQVQTKGRRCSMKNGSAGVWQCSNQAHPGYTMCLKHVISRRSILKKAKAKKKLIQASAKSGLAASNAADAETSATGGWKETAVPSSPKPLVGATRSKEASRENATAASSAKEKGKTPVPTKGPRCTRNNGRANGWRCSAEAHPGYVMCLPHYINRRNSCEKSRVKKLQARAESNTGVYKTADAGASTSATGGRKETGPSSTEPLVSAKRRKAGTRAVRFQPDETGPAPVHTQLEAPCIVINIAVASEQQQ